jgi:hypothetical protein
MPLDPDDPQAQTPTKNQAKPTQPVACRGGSSEILGDLRNRGRTDDRHNKNASHLFLRLADDSLSIPCIDNEIFIVRGPS